jgi:acyl-CoA thioester hydrolase
LVVDHEAAEAYVETVGRPHALRLRPQAYPLSGAVSVRYSDLDPNGHVNNVALAAMHEGARAQLTDIVFPGAHSPEGRHARIVNSQNVVHFLAEAHWPGTLDSGIGVAKIGRTSFTLSSALFRDGQCVSVCDAVMVAILDKPVPLTADARMRLQELRMRFDVTTNGKPAPLTITGVAPR